MSAWCLVALGLQSPRALAEPQALIVGGTAGGDELKLHADRLDFLPRHNRIQLKGHVKLVGRGIVIRSDVLSVALHPRTRRPRQIVATGLVSLELEEKTRATARTATLTLDAKDPTIVLEEALITAVEQGLQVRGKRIYLSIGSGKLVVHQASASLPARGEAHAPR